MADVGRHPNIRVLANTDVTSIEGDPGHFEVLLTRRPRYVDEDLCVACRTCATYCPFTRSNPFDENLSTAKAIDVLCPQAVPASAVVDRESCLYFKNQCTICLPVCQAKAIDLNQKRKKALARVGAIILATGYEIFDPEDVKQYGYGRMKNVVTSIEFERLLHAEGPHHGEIRRPSDGNIPQKIGWIQCVGSRDKNLGHSYCSGICCTYAVKQIMLVKNHYPDTQVAVFHNDIRTYGKGFEDLYERARAVEGIRFIKNRVPAIRENPESHNLILNYFSGSRNVEEEFEMVVLSVGMSPGADNLSLARMLGLDLNEHGFFKTGGFSPNESVSRPGVFPAATAIGPMDIPESISSSVGAVSLAAQLLADQRGSLTQPKIFPEEQSVEGKRPRIGVFVCRCGTNIAGVADVSALVEHALSLKNVAYSEEHTISCAADSCKKISKAIQEKALNRVVVAACTPRDHEEVFREALRESGLNPYLLEMANIREHCTWVHSVEKQESTQKAKDLISMAVAKAEQLIPLEEVELPVTPSCLILGGGLAGMQTALSVARQNFEVFLIEKEKELGGNLRNLHYTLDGSEIRPFLERLVQDVEREERIKVYKGYEPKSFSGYVGNFKTVVGPSRLASENDVHASDLVQLEHGVVVVAAGGRPLQPSEYGYGSSEQVMTQQEFEHLLASGHEVKELRQVIMIQCVGARNEERPYCSRICCGTALKNAMKLRRLNGNTQIIVFHRDLRSFGFLEDVYTQARESGISFIRYAAEEAPDVRMLAGRLEVSFHDRVLHQEGRLHPDLVVLSTPIIPNGTRELSQLLRVPLTSDGFFMEAHMKLRPLDFATDGMFLCGTAQYPKFIPETISQANGAAARAATLLSRKTVAASGAVAQVTQEDCIGCGLCIDVCPYKAIILHEIAEGKSARVVPAACKGCGVCASNCPTGAVVHNCFTDRQILSQIRAAYSVPMKKPKPKVLAFLCHWCGYAAADLAGVSRMQYATNVRVVRVMCSGRIHPRFIYEAFLSGLDGVMVVACHEEDCHYVSGIHHTMRNIPSTRKALEEMGIDPRRLKLECCSAAEGAKYAAVIDAFTSSIEDLGGLELDEGQRERLLGLKEKRTKER